MDQSGIFPTQKNTHPWREGVTYERFQLDRVTQQVEAFRKNIPEDFAAFRAGQKWLGKVQTAADRYGMGGVIG